jgi:hypothetical protein
MPPANRNPRLQINFSFLQHALINKTLIPQRNQFLIPISLRPQSSLRPQLMTMNIQAKLTLSFFLKLFENNLKIQ